LNCSRCRSRYDNVIYIDEKVHGDRVAAVKE